MPLDSPPSPPPLSLSPTLHRGSAVCPPALPRSAVDSSRSRPGPPPPALRHSQRSSRPSTWTPPSRAWWTTWTRPGRRCCHPPPPCSTPSCRGPCPGPGCCPWTCCPPWWSCSTHTSQADTSTTRGLGTRSSIQVLRDKPLGFLGDNQINTVHLNKGLSGLRVKWISCKG